MPEIRKKIVCAMSGGVDSSVAAAILKNQGYNIVGVFMYFWSDKSDQTRINADSGRISHGYENKCCSPEAREAARKVAKKLGIPFYVLNFKKEFKRQVVDYFLKEYASGLTPNPCIECNRKIKFDLLLKRVLGMGVDYIATGHYARLRREIRNPKSEIRNYKYKLFIAKDKGKDQSYFLYTLGQKQLKYILFPLGDYTKGEVKKLADKWGLPYQERESEDICFISGKDHNQFLKRHLKLKPGKIVCGGKPGSRISTKKLWFFEKKPVEISLPGKIIGEHEGLPLYTIGQRKEIKLAGGPYWVVGADFKKNLLKVTDVPNDSLLYKDSLEARNVNWISGREPDLPLKVEVKIRYRHPAVPAIVRHATVRHRVSNERHSVSNSYWVKFNQPQRAVTPGQSVVFYKGAELLGGGIIS